MRNAPARAEAVRRRVTRLLRPHPDYNPQDALGAATLRSPFQTGQSQPAPRPLRRI